MSVGDWALTDLHEYYNTGIFRKTIVMTKTPVFILVFGGSYREIPSKEDIKMSAPCKEMFQETLKKESVKFKTSQNITDIVHHIVASTHFEECY